MMYLSKSDIEKMPRIQRLNTINSVTGIKPANLIGTRSEEGLSNLAIFSSVVHLGSNPALLGFFFRPQHQHPKDTYRNIRSTAYYTINQVPAAFIRNAHFTSAKFPPELSEFERCGLHEEYQFGFHAPFVKESLLRIGLEMQEEIPVRSNDTILMIGRILHLQFPDQVADAEGHLDLEKMGSAGISGVNTYYTLKKEKQFPYARLEEVPVF